jgi:hypothetical protein
MIRAMIDAILGPWGATALDWALEHSAITGGVLFLWIAALLLGKAQLQRVERKTHAFVLQQAWQLLGREPGLTAHELYDLIYPEWCQWVKGLAFFIPHRWEMWPVPASPARLRERLGLTPAWLASHLRSHGVLPHGDRFASHTSSVEGGEMQGSKGD